jgi:hypothetical protein
MNYLLRVTPSDIQIRGMAHPQSLRHPLFRRRWFADLAWAERAGYQDLEDIEPITVAAYIETLQR